MITNWKLPSMFIWNIVQNERILFIIFGDMQAPKSVEILEMEMKQMKETINKIDENVSKISSFIFEWWIEEKFVSQKTFELTIEALEKELDQKGKMLDELKSNQSKVIRIVITGVLSAILGLVIKSNIL